ncbi:hypothetical protein GYMLUDRAFT_70162 [Collybiopsis luxurians FD-317 M1]|nr:hypothetical protein GYMLUDRAFT_70162 [Collybiopsis luxurians FD-317 M1]
MDSINFTLGTKLRTNNYLYLLAFTLLYYDHLLTFDAEVQFIWSHLSTSKLFLLNRYFSFGGNIVVLLLMFFVQAGVLSCHPWAEFQQFFHAFVQVIVTILMTMQIVVLYGRDKRVIVGLVFAIVLGICVTIVSLTFSHSTIAVSLYPIGLVSTGWVLTLIYDALLFSMTLFKAYQERSQPKVKLSLFMIIVQDGSMYFGYAYLNMLTFFDSLLRGTFSPFTSCMSVTLMSQLMLHLHKIADERLYVCHGDMLAIPADTYSTIAFNNQGIEKGVNYAENTTDGDVDGSSSPTDTAATPSTE